MAEPLLIRKFTAADQVAAAEVITLGLGERWGHIDRTKNPDLYDIAEMFSAGCFLVGEIDDELIATGAYLPEVGTSGTVRMQRMSVLKIYRGRGYGKQMLRALEQHAKESGNTHAVLETTESWLDAIQFYLGQGYQTESVRDGDMHFTKTLE